MKENDDTLAQAAQLERWQRLACFAEAQWQWFEAAYRALVQDLLHNQEHPEGPARTINLAAALEKFSGPPAAATAPHKRPAHVGDSAFESWYQSHPKASGGDKQLARDAYAAGMSDPLASATELPSWPKEAGGMSA